MASIGIDGHLSYVQGGRAYRELMDRAVLHVPTERARLLVESAKEVGFLELGAVPPDLLRDVVLALQVAVRESITAIDGRQPEGTERVDPDGDCRQLADTEYLEDLLDFERSLAAAFGAHPQLRPIGRLDHAPITEWDPMRCDRRPAPMIVVPGHRRLPIGRGDQAKLVRLMRRHTQLPEVANAWLRQSLAEGYIRLDRLPDTLEPFIVPSFKAAARDWAAADAKRERNGKPAAGWYWLLPEWLDEAYPGDSDQG